jgi:hypothetical protein
VLVVVDDVVELVVVDVVVEVVQVVATSNLLFELSVSPLPPCEQLTNTNKRDVNANALPPLTRKLRYF